MKRCWGETEPMRSYHDLEWGTPLHDDRTHFEFLILEGFQAGLNWVTVLKKREAFRKAFHNFNPQKVSRYKEKDVKRLLNNEGIIRNRLKIRAAIKNAQIFLKVQEEFGSFDKYIWQFVKGKPIQNKMKSFKKMKATSKESDALSSDLKKRGFSFVGSTICYALMQATGMVNDHLMTCFRYKKLS